MVASDRYIVYSTLTKQHLYVGLVWLRIQIIDQRDSQIDLMTTTNAAISASPPNGPEFIQVTSAGIFNSSNASLDVYKRQVITRERKKFLWGNPFEMELRRKYRNREKHSR